MASMIYWVIGAFGVLISWLFVLAVGGGIGWYMTRTVVDEGRKLVKYWHEKGHVIKTKELYVNPENKEATHPGDTVNDLVIYERDGLFKKKKVQIPANDIFWEPTSDASGKRIYPKVLHVYASNMRSSHLDTLKKANEKIIDLECDNANLKMGVAVAEAENKDVGETALDKYNERLSKIFIGLPRKK